MINLLAIDIGNTNISVALFAGRRLVRRSKIATAAYHSYVKELKVLFSSCGLAAGDVDSAVVSSVVPLALARLVVALNMTLKCKVAIVGKDVKVPIRNLYKVKSEVGQDRLVNAFAAKTLYGAPAVIIDFGTAITFDLVSRRGDYLGGLILPGIDMSLRSLYTNTALLPRVALKISPHIIGKDTVNSIRGGILFGFGAMCDGLVAEYRKILGKNLKAIATGGNARLIKKYARSIQIVDEDITLKGLLLISTVIASPPPKAARRSNLN